MIIPIPGIDFPLPGGMGANATIGEIEDALKGAGKSFEDFLEDPIGTIQGVFGNVWDKIKDIWNSAEDKTWGNLIKILTDAGFGAIVGILGDKILDEIVVDSGNPFLPFTPVSCEQADYYAANEEACFEEGYVNCDATVDPETGQQLSGGYKLLKDCEGVVDPRCVSDVAKYEDGRCVCPDGYEVEGEEDPIDGCGERIDLTEPCPDFNGAEGPRDDEGNCLDCTDPANALVCGWVECDDGTFAPTRDECKEVTPPPPGDLCGEGTELNGQPPKYDFNDLEKNGSYTFGGNQYTYDPCNPSQGPTLVTDPNGGGDGGGGTDPLDCAEITDDNATLCGKKKCPDGTFVDEGVACGANNPCDDPVYASENEDECGGGGGFVVDCNKPRPTGTVTFDLIDQQRAWDIKCGGGGGGTEVCDNGATVESGCETCEDGTPVDSYEDGKCILLLILLLLHPEEALEAVVAVVLPQKRQKFLWE